MLVTQVTRHYSRSVNTKNYGVPESWIKIEARYTATCESGDDPTKVSELLYEQAKNDVVSDMATIIAQIKDSLKQSVAPVPPTYNSPAPVAPAPAPAQSTNVPYQQPPRQL